MRREDDARRREQRVVRRGRLAAEDVQPGAADRACLEQLHQGGLVDERATRGIDDDRVRPKHREQPPVDYPLGLRRVGEVERDDVRRREEVVELDDRRAQLPLPVRRPPPRPADDRHSQSAAELDHPCSDRAGTDHAEPPTVQLNPLRLPPGAGADGTVAVRDASGDGQRQSQGVLGDRVRTVARNIADGHVTRARLVHLDVGLDSGADEADHAHTGAGKQDARRQAPEQEDTLGAAQTVDPAIDRLRRRVEPLELVPVRLQTCELLRLEEAVILRLAVRADELHAVTAATRPPRSDGPTPLPEYPTPKRTSSRPPSREKNGSPTSVRSIGPIQAFVTGTSRSDGYKERMLAATSSPRGVAPSKLEPIRPPKASLPPPLPKTTRPSSVVR